MIWYIVSSPLWLAGFISVFMGVLNILVGQTGRGQQHRPSFQQDILLEIYSISLVVAGSFMWSAAARFCGY